MSASDVATKAVELKALGGSYGGNNKPTRFLCLALKMLQIQPEEGIVEEFLQNEDFKYIRALGAFYLRLTGRPAEIYELIEPLYNDFRKLRFRESTGWKITYMDELAYELLTSERYCGIALPHLPKRDVLVSAGYLDGPRRSALTPLIDEKAGGDAEIFLQQLADEGNDAAKAAMDERISRKNEAEEKERKIIEERETHMSREEQSSKYDQDDDFNRYRRESHRSDDGGYRRRDRDDRYDNGDDRHSERSGDRRHASHHEDERNERRHRSDRSKDERRKEKKSSRDKKYGSLFKKSSKSDRGEISKKSKEDNNPAEDGANDGNTFEGSQEYWNDQRAKLGLKPLKD